MTWEMVARAAVVIAVTAGVAVGAPLPSEAPTDRPLAVAPDQVTIVKPVTDIGKHVSDAEREREESQLVKLRTQTGIQMAVVVVDSTAPLSIEKFAQGVFDRWHGGSAKRDDGILLVFAIRDRKSRLQLGDGIARVISDDEAKRILDDQRPLLRQSLYGGAISRVIDQVTALVDHIVPGGPLARKPVPFGVGSWLHLLLIVAVGIAAGMAWQSLRRVRPTTGFPWYLTPWIALVWIALGGLAVAGLYRGGPWLGYAVMCATSMLFGISFGRLVQKGWGGAVLLLLAIGFPLLLPTIIFVSIGLLHVDTVDGANGASIVFSGAAALIGGIGFTAGRGRGGGSSRWAYNNRYETTYSTSYSSTSSSSSSSSSSSGGSDWSGGGGSSSGGGASSDW